ncbi:MAG: NTP transferase domain-containing protein, partial [Kangiellaceae bacterium]|nr:NTP transferase domain-containing protein [Kangiellaceae bacterium]
MIQDKQLGIVIIAAGNSSRLGSAKQLIKFKGHSLLQRTIKLANIASNHWVCVLGYQADRVRLELQSEGSAIGD